MVHEYVGAQPDLLRNAPAPRIPGRHGDFPDLLADAPTYCALDSPSGPAWEGAGLGLELQGPAQHGLASRPPN